MGPYSYSVVNMHYSSRKGKNDTEGDSETIRAATATTGPGVRLFPQRMGLLLWLQWARMALPSTRGVGPKQRAPWVGPLHRAEGAGSPAEPWGWCCHPSGPGGQSIETKDDYSWALRSSGICLAVVWACLGPINPFFLPISPSWNAIIYPMPVPPSHFFFFKVPHIPKSKQITWAGVEWGLSSNS